MQLSLLLADVLSLVTVISRLNAALARLRDADGLTHHIGRGRFHNPWDSFKSFGFMEFVKLALFEWDRGRSKPVAFPVSPLDFPAVTAPPANAVQATWIGHATVLVQMHGFNVLTDPVFSHRCSPVQFAGPARMAPASCTVAELPRLDAVLLSHNHYDHLDVTSVRDIAMAHPECVWYTPLGNAAYLHPLGVRHVVELDWWERAELTQADVGADRADRADAPRTLHVVCTPCQHFSGRSGLQRDKNAALWSSFALIAEVRL
jgi:N-acyl-phosphatidylethanolamine-hydrolysing phospholipase D